MNPNLIPKDTRHRLAHLLNSTARQLRSAHEVAGQAHQVVSGSQSYGVDGVNTVAELEKEIEKLLHRIQACVSIATLTAERLEYVVPRDSSKQK
ncbi:MAG: hypothetical protein P9E24_02935 [Candidatus Competibacter sp.]|nr:hypothetical protein [Candidatus Competibacter sp.]MDG4583174.1 hypothetical protein [Candidatus Competibacter sp.]